MGAAVPIVGAVVGTASAVSQISASNKAAKQQSQALLAQEKSAQSNLALRLQEIERQRLYAQYASQLNELSRLSNLSYQQNEDAMTRQEINMNTGMQVQQALMNENLQYMQGNTQLASLNQQRGQADMNRNMQLTADQQQQRLARGQFGAQELGQQMADAGQLSQFNAQERLQMDSAMNQLIGNFTNQQVAAGNQAVQNAAAQAEGMAQFRELGQAAEVEGRQLRTQEAQARQGLSARGFAGQSMSDRRVADQLQNEGIRNALQRQQILNEGRSTLQANRELGDALVGFSRNESQRALVQGTRQTLTGQAINRAGLNQQLALNAYGRDVGRTGFEAEQELGSFLSNYGYQAGVLADAQNAAIQQNQVWQANELAKGQSEYAILQAVLDAGLEHQAMDILQQARVQNHQLQNAAAALNQTFTDEAFSQQAFSTVNSGNAQIAALQAQRGSISSPGLLGYAGALAQGGMGIRQALYTPPTLNTAQFGTGYGANFGAGAAGAQRGTGLLSGAAGGARGF